LSSTPSNRQKMSSFAAKDLPQKQFCLCRQ
jgi:hypothetical protein